MHTCVVIQLIGQTTEGAKRYPLELPPKPTQKTSAPSQTATADGFQHEPSNELRKHDNTPHQTLPDTLLSASHGNDDTSGINEEKKVTIYVAQNNVNTCTHNYNYATAQRQLYTHMNLCGFGFLLSFSLLRSVYTVAMKILMPRDTCYG